MADTPDPYLRKDPGDIMLAADWNEMQVRARTELRVHDHTGDATRQIPREGIRDKAIDASKIDPDIKLGLKELSINGPLKVTGTSQLADIRAALASFSGARLTTSGDLGIGTETPENAEGWNRVADLVGSEHAKLSVRAGDIDSRLMSHVGGFFGAEPGMIIGTKSPHPVSLVSAGSLRLRVHSAKAGDGSETPVVDFFPANNPLRISSSWTGKFDSTTNGAEICNDAVVHKTLMLVGNSSAGMGRRVSVWDRLDVNGSTFSHGLDVSAEVPQHLDGDGTFYRWQGQVYLNVDDNLYIRDSSRGIRMHFDTISGTFKTDVLRLGDKWRLSGIGDHEANDEWLRLKNVANNAYWGGFAASKMWTVQGQYHQSDQRLKCNIQEIGEALPKLNQLRGVCFNWKSDTSKAVLGLLAQDVEAVLPQAVSEGPEGWKGIDTTAVVALLVQAVKEQQTMIEKLCNALPLRG